MTPVQLDMALAAVRWGVRDLAAVADVSMDTIARFKRGERIKDSTRAAMRSALEAAGVEFIPENGGGVGVRLKKEEPASSPE
jgi:DNA-binding Xre family transcriptional regulator